MTYELKLTLGPPGLISVLIKTFCTYMSQLVKFSRPLILDRRQAQNPQYIYSTLIINFSFETSYELPHTGH